MNNAAFYIACAYGMTVLVIVLELFFLRRQRSAARRRIRAQR